MDIQKMMDAMSEASKATRSQYHVTLGDLIEFLEPITPEWPVLFEDGLASPACPHSYRGHYSDLSFDRDSERTVAEVLAMCKVTLGSVLTGWKGGDFTMDTCTPIWCAREGDTGEAVVDVVTGTIDGRDCVILKTKNVD